MVTKTISNWVNRSLRSGHLVIGPVLFPAVSSQKRLAQACTGLVLQRSVLEYFSLVSMAAQVRTKRIIA